MGFGISGMRWWGEERCAVVEMGEVECGGVWFGWWYGEGGGGVR